MLETIFDWNRVSQPAPKTEVRLVDASSSAVAGLASKRKLLMAAAKLGLSEAFVGTVTGEEAALLATQAHQLGIRLSLKLEFEESELPAGVLGYYSMPVTGGGLELNRAGRMSPARLAQELATACRHGVSRVCLRVSDRISLEAVRVLVNFCLEKADGLELEWDFQNEEECAIGCALQAASHGASLLRGSALALTPSVSLDQLFVNLVLEQHRAFPGNLKDYMGAIARHTSRPIPPSRPISGLDAFRTATGVHAAAVVKALTSMDRSLGDRVYSGVPATPFGFSQIVDVGPMSGRHNVVHWLRSKNLMVTDETVNKILRLAKSSNRVLSECELLAAIGLDGLI